jgi:hypothetical protein
MQQMLFIADLIACSTCLGHHYAHHQEFERIIQMVAACGIWCCKDGNLPNLQITFSIFTAPNTTGSNHLYNTLELLTMDIMVPEIC